jgi:hypothetical protein
MVVLTAQSVMVPWASSPFVFGIAPMLPEQYTRPLYFIAWEYWGRGFGAEVVRMASISGAIASKFAFCERGFVPLVSVAELDL